MSISSSTARYRWDLSLDVAMVYHALTLTADSLILHWPRQCCRRHHIGCYPLVGIDASAVEEACSQAALYRPYQLRAFEVLAAGAERLLSARQLREFASRPLRWRGKFQIFNQTTPRIQNNTSSKRIRPDLRHLDRRPLQRTSSVPRPRWMESSQCRRHHDKLRVLLARRSPR